MTDYLNFNDLKAAVIGVVVFFLCLGIQQYWSNRTVKSVKRRIEAAEAEKARLTDLATSEKALLIMGFQTIFFLLGFMCFIFFFQTVHLAVLKGNGYDGLTMLILFFWGVIALISIYASDMVKKVERYPGSLETIEKKIQRLKNRLRGSSRDNEKN